MIDLPHERAVTPQFYFLPEVKSSMFNVTTAYVECMAGKSKVTVYRCLVAGLVASCGRCLVA